MENQQTILVCVRLSVEGAGRYGIMLPSLCLTWYKQLLDHGSSIWCMLPLEYYPVANRLRMPSHTPAFCTKNTCHVKHVSPTLSTATLAFIKGAVMCMCAHMSTRPLAARTPKGEEAMCPLKRVPTVNHPRPFPPNQATKRFLPTSFPAKFHLVRPFFTPFRRYRLP